MALNAKLTNGSECLTMNDDSERQTEDIMALNVKLTNGSKCRTEDMIALNAKRPMALNV